ncbi:MAG: cytochrome c biogenesis CcdA family protein [bacterium]|nr:cytochrome c biogenesis CcdA family protein [bacterium]
MKKWSVILFVFLVSLSVVSALVLPESIQKIIDYNNQQAAYYLENITYIVAFLAGLLAVLSPCTLAIVPMYFSYGLKERSTVHTFAFFLGFTTVFISLGLIASFLGQSILFFQAENSFLIFLAGLFLIVFGVMQIAGKGFSFLPVKVFKAKSIFGVFVLGVLFALGWSACTGPILGGVLLIASVFGSYFQVALLMFFYALGNFVPFFLLSFAVDGFKLHEKSWIRGKMISFNFFGTKIETHSTQVIAGLLLVFMGVLFILFQDTSVFNTINIGGANLKGYSLQEGLLTNGFVPFLGIILLIVLIGFLVYFLLRRR